MRCAGYPTSVLGELGDPFYEPCHAAPNGWTQGPVVRVSFLPFPSQSWVTASSPRAPPPYLWSLETHCSAPAKVNPVPSPSRMGIRESTHSGGAHTHIPPLRCPLGCGPHGNPPSWPLPQTASHSGTCLPGYPCPYHSVPAGRGAGGRTRLEGRGTHAATDPQVGAGTGAGVADGAGSSGRARGPGAVGPGAAAELSFPAALYTGPARGASSRPGRERRGRCDASGTADWSSPGWHRPRRPRKPRLHLKIPHSPVPPSPLCARLVLKLTLLPRAMYRVPWQSENSRPRLSLRTPSHPFSKIRCPNSSHLSTFAHQGADHSTHLQR